MDNNIQKIGYGLLFLGIVLLLITFYMAVNTFLNPEFIQGFSDLLPQTGESGIGNIVHALIYFVPGIILWVMGGIAGRFLKHGIVLIRSKSSSSGSKSSRSRTSRNKTSRSKQSTETDRQRPSSAKSRSSKTKKQEDKKEF